MRVPTAPRRPGAGRLTNPISKSLLPPLLLDDEEESVAPPSRVRLWSMFKASKLKPGDHSRVCSDTNACDSVEGWPPHRPRLDARPFPLSLRLLKPGVVPAPSVPSSLKVASRALRCRHRAAAVAVLPASAKALAPLRWLLLKFPELRRFAARLLLLLRPRWRCEER